MQNNAYDVIETLFPANELNKYQISKNGSLHYTQVTRGTEYLASVNAIEPASSPLRWRTGRLSQSYKLTEFGRFLHWQRVTESGWWQVKYKRKALRSSDLDGAIACLLRIGKAKESRLLISLVESIRAIDSLLANTKQLSLLYGVVEEELWIDRLSRSPQYTLVKFFSRIMTLTDGLKTLRYYGRVPECRRFLQQLEFVSMSFSVLVKEISSTTKQ